MRSILKLGPAKLMLVLAGHIEPEQAEIASDYEYGMWRMKQSSDIEKDIVH
jgi:hypothetical protein